MPTVAERIAAILLEVALQIRGADWGRKEGSLIERQGA